MNSTGISQFNQARIEWAIRLRYSPMPDLDMQMLGSQLNAFRIGELRTVGKTWEIMMERDGELAINSDKRKADSACLEWQIASDGSPDGDKHAAALQYFYNNLTATKALDQDSTGGVDDLIYQTLSSLDYYYSAHEILLRIDNAAAKEITAEFRHTPVWFFEARRGYLGYLKHIFDLYGTPCIAGEWLTAVNIGWMRSLCMAYAVKWFSFTDWQIFCRRYGSGFLEATTNATQDSKEWNDAVTALTKLANEGVVLHNQGVEFKFLEQAARNQLPFQPVVELIDRLYAKCYRGVDLATGSRGMGAESGGERAGGRNPVGASVQKEESGILLIRDSKWITGVFNDRIDRPIIRYLFNQEPRAWFALLPPPDDTTSEDLQSLQTLVPMGLRVALKEVYKRFRWSIPDAGDPCLTPPAVPAATSIDARGDTQRSMLSPSPLPPGGEGPGGESPKSDVETPTLDDLKLRAGSDDSEDQKTHQAQTNENTPIAAGADPARNPGLVATAYDRSTSNGASNLDPSAIDQPRSNSSTLQLFNAPSRQMPDTQVDSSAFWSRTALMPQGPDGQTLPMPSLGYAVPNDSGTSLNELVDRHADLAARGLANCRAAQALKGEINRRQLEAQNSKPFVAPKPGEGGDTNSIALSNWQFDPDQPRDRYGKWTAGDNDADSKPNNPIPTNVLNPLVARPAPQTTPTNMLASLVARPSAQTTLNPIQNLSAQVGGPTVDAGASKTNSPSQSTELPFPPTDGSYAVQTSTTSAIGDLLNRAGETLYHEIAAGAFQIIGDQQDALKEIGVPPGELKGLGYKDVEDDQGTTGEDPYEEGIQDLPLVPRAISSGVAGIAKSLPRLGIAAVDPYLGAYAFGAQPDGFDLKQAALTLLLPMVGKGGGALTGQIAAKAGVSPGLALQMFNKLGGAAGVVSLIGADQLQQIMKLPPDRRNKALLDAAGNAGAMFLMGMLGGEEKPAETARPENVPSKSAEIPQKNPAEEIPPKPQAPEPSAAPKPPPQPLSAAERQTLERDIQARRPISADTLARANASGGVNIPKGYVIDFPNNRLVYAGTDNPLPAGSAPDKSPTPPPGTQRQESNRTLDSDDGRLPSLQGNIPNAVKRLPQGYKSSYFPDGSFIITNPKGVSVKYNALGFPDFSPYLYRGSDGRGVQEEIDLTGDRDKDEAAANAKAKLPATPRDYTWHHNENTGLMQLVDKAVHKEFSHLGGFSLNKNSTQQ